jgi:hypothetical protein
MWRKTLSVAATAGLLVAFLAAPAGAAPYGGVRVAKDGQGAYEGTGYLPNEFGGMPAYVVTILAESRTKLQIYVHPRTTCYPPHKRLKQDAFGSGLPVPIPNVPLSSTGSFHKSEMTKGDFPSSSIISGQIAGNKASGTFSATGITADGGICDNVSFAWTAIFEPNAQPDPTIFRAPQ